MKKFRIVTILSAMMLIFSSSLFAEGTELSVKKFDPYAVIKAYYGYHNTSPEVGDSETDLAYRLQTNSRFGANFEVENVKLQVELGLQSAVNLRLAVAAVDFGPLKVTLGQTYTPYTWLATGDYVDDNNFTGFGASYDGRTPQLRLDLAGAYVSFIGVSRNTTGAYGATTTTAIKDTTALAPKTSIGYDYKSGASVFGFGGAGNIVKINDSTSAANKKNIKSWLGYVHTNAVLGDFIFRGNFAYGQNTGNFGILNVEKGNTDALIQTFSTSASAVQSGTSLKNTTTIEGYINPQYKLTSDLLIGAGVGYAKADNDTYTKADAQIAYFVDAKYNINKYFSILPEFAYRDYLKDKNGVKQGTEYYSGVQLQISI